MVLHRTKQSVGHQGFTQQLRAEFTAFRMARSCTILLCAVVLVFVLVSFVSALASHGGNTAVPTGPDGEPVTDTYTFVHQTLVGDGTLTARVASLSGAHLSTDISGNASGARPTSQSGSQLQPGPAPWAKAGIILEPDTNQGTDYAAVMVTGSHGVQMQYDYTHDSPGLPGPVEPSSPRWLRLTRVGDVITGYDSTDGVHWTEIGTVRLTGLPHTVQIGLFVTSPLYFAAGANDGTPSVATAAFDQLATQGDLPQPLLDRRRDCRVIPLSAVRFHLGPAIRRRVYHQWVRRHRTARRCHRLQHLVGRKHRQRDDRRAPAS